MYRLLFIGAALVAIVLALLGTSYIQNKNALAEWRASGYSPGQLLTLSNERVFSRTLGEGDTGILILPGFGASIVEWWPLQEKLAQGHLTLSLDKPGYSLGTPFEKGFEKFPSVISEALNLTPQVKKWILLAHSTSAYLAKEVFEKDPRIVGLVAIDPLIDPQTVAEESNNEWYEVFIDAKPRLERAIFFARIGFLRFVNSTPYDVPNEIRPFVLNNLAAEQTALAMKSEYNWIFRGPITFAAQNRPLVVYHHNPENNIRLMIDFSAPDDVATRFEEAWQNSSRRFLQLSDKSIWRVGKKGLFSPHIEAPEEILSAVQTLEQELAK